MPLDGGRRGHWAGLLLVCLVAPTAADEELSPINIGTRKQLFIDNYLIESSAGVRFVMNSPQRDGKLLLTNDQPWESGPNMYINNYCCVLKENGVVRLWYDLWRGGEDRHGREAYAESADGLHFTKPVQNQYTVNGSKRNNIVIPGSIGGCSVWIDPQAPAEHRYKTQAKVYPSSQFHMHSSPDGLHWSLYARPNPGPGGWDSQSNIFWDPRVKRYALFTRFWKSHRHKTAPAPNDHRTVRRLESDDLIHWDNQTIAMQPDEIDVARYATRATPPGKPPLDFYGATVFRYSEQPLYIMLAHAYWHWQPRNPKELDFGPAAMDVRLATSRDGIHFQKTGNRAPFMALGRSGTFDSKVVWTLPNPVRMGDELWIYYRGSNQDHDNIIDPAANGKLMTGIGRAVLRLDGFVSADADHTGGQITTPPLTFQGKHLELNVDTSGGGSVFVELLDQDGQPIAGFSRHETVPVNGNSVRMPVHWNSDISQLAGKLIRIRFLMRECKLYAFQFVN
ncbi:MAG: hypothetical protein CMJ81_19905 [Planctomycetaceae bacterium]|nr:hypothetical protein [Planctomycetaceae bacterium]